MNDNGNSSHCNVHLRKEVANHLPFIPHQRTYILLSRESQDKVPGSLENLIQIFYTRLFQYFFPIKTIITNSFLLKKTKTGKTFFLSMKHTINLSKKFNLLDNKLIIPHTA